MLTRRVVVCLDVKGGRVVKGTQFVQLRDVGDPVALASRYEQEGADEVVFLDISASAEERGTLLDVARRTAESLFVPLTIGGGVRTVDDVGRALRSGADKVSINSAAVVRPEILTEAAERFGSQCVVASIDVRRSDDNELRCLSYSGTRDTGREPVDCAREVVDRGAGEILLTSVDRDGTMTGYDLDLIGRVAAAVAVPVIASGGAGTYQHMVDAVTKAGASAVAAASMFHFTEQTPAEAKAAMHAAGIPVRRALGPGAGSMARA